MINYVFYAICPVLIKTREAVAASKWGVSDMSNKHKLFLYKCSHSLVMWAAERLFQSTTTACVS